MNSYELSRRWFDFAFEKKEAKAYHTALFMWCIELNNRLGWKDEFGLPTHDTMEGLGIGNRNTYRATLKDLAAWNFIKIVQEPKNQFQACYISIVSPKKCPTKNEQALDKSLNRQWSGQRTDTDAGTASSTGQGSELIDKPENNETNKQEKELLHVDKFYNEGLDVELSDEMKKALNDWLAYKKQSGQEVKSVVAVEKILRDMFLHSDKEDDWIWMIDFSISRTAKGIITDLKQKPEPKQAPTFISKLKPEENKW